MKYQKIGGLFCLAHISGLSHSEKLNRNITHTLYSIFMERLQDLAVGPVLFRPIIIGQIAAHDVTDGSGTYVSGGLPVPIL